MLEMEKGLQMDPKELMEFVKFTQNMDVLEQIGSSNNTKTIFVNPTSTGDNHQANMMQALEASK